MISEGRKKRKERRRKGLEAEKRNDPYRGLARLQETPPPMYRKPGR